MNGRELFEVWAPTRHERWTKFAKPALFINMRENWFAGRSFQMPEIPSGMDYLNNETTAVIIDLPGASGVENGLALAKSRGFIPVPLYNVVDEDKIGFLSKMVDNAPIVSALQAGAGILQDNPTADTAPPVFLLDYDRNNEMEDNSGRYDNRWSIDFEDMPDADYMKQSRINRVIVWTAGEIRKDLLPIVESYQNIGIEILTYNDGQLTLLSGTVSSAAATAAQEHIRKFENARFALLLISGVALVNLFFMFFVRYEPLWWTTPSIMWLTYLWVPEIVGDALAVAFTAVYAALYFLSFRRRNLMMGALAFFGVDAGIFYVYVLYYGIDEWLAGLGWILLIIPIYCIVLLYRGVTAQISLNDMGHDEYTQALDQLDTRHYGGVVRRRHFRGFRGYGGYGGSGRGGYRGGGYRGYGGGYGGGFGG